MRQGVRFVRGLGSGASRTSPGCALAACSRPMSHGSQLPPNRPGGTCAESGLQRREPLLNFAHLQYPHRLPSRCDQDTTPIRREIERQRVTRGPFQQRLNPHGSAKVDLIPHTIRRAPTASDTAVLSCTCGGCRKRRIMRVAVAGRQRTHPAGRTCPRPRRARPLLISGQLVGKRRRHPRRRLEVILRHRG